MAFGRPVAQNANIRDWIAESRIDLEMARLLVLKTAWLMDTVGNQRARIEISGIKFAVPAIALRIIDSAIQPSAGAPYHSMNWSSVKKDRVIVESWYRPPSSR